METKSVFHIFESIDRVKHKIIKRVMKENNLKMVAIESIPDPKNKIHEFIQGFFYL